LSLVGGSELSGARVAGREVESAVPAEVLVEGVEVELDAVEVFGVVEGDGDGDDLDAVPCRQLGRYLRARVGAEPDHRATSSGWLPLGEP
jgi:hypothetical protein